MLINPPEESQEDLEDPSSWTFTEDISSPKLTVSSEGWKVVVTGRLRVADPEVASAWMPAVGSEYPRRVGGNVRCAFLNGSIDPGPGIDYCSVTLNYVQRVKGMRGLALGEEVWDWDITGQPTTLYSVPQPGYQENSDGSSLMAIGLQGATVQGAQVYRAFGRLSVRKGYAQITGAHVNTWETLANSLNDAPWPNQPSVYGLTEPISYAAGEVLYIGAKFQQTRKIGDIEEVTHEFLVGRNQHRMGFALAGGNSYTFAVIGAHDTIWTRMVDSAGSNLLETDLQPLSVHRAQTYPFVSFWPLDLGGPRPFHDPFGPFGEFHP
jgi:hypothetical protein